MTIYVDNARTPFRRMKMSHMLAETEDELHAMADTIGLKREWFQGDHYDVSLEKRHAAIQAGAKVITGRQIVGIRREFNAKKVMCSWRFDEPERFIPKPYYSLAMIRVADTMWRRAEHYLKGPAEVMVGPYFELRNLQWRIDFYRKVDSNE